VILVALGAVVSSVAFADGKKQGEDAADNLDDRLRLGKAVSHGKLTLVPLHARAKVKDKRDFLTLDEAFQKKLVKVRELDDESVNELSIENRSKQPLFVMSGEVILGGKQDRIIGKDTIIGPKERAVVDVFCVEHGRWSEEKGSREFRSGKTLAHGSLRNQANFETQQRVWDEVDSKNAKRKTDNDTQTYRKLTADGDTGKAAKPYLEALTAGLAKSGADTVGFVVVLNGEIVAVEAFGSPKLYAKMRDKLVRSWVLEAVDAPEPDDEEAAARVPVAKDVKAFQARAAEAEKATVVNAKKAKTKHVKGSGVAGSRVEAEDDAADAAPVYEGLYKH
jgi:hypothetical protein